MTKHSCMLAVVLTLLYVTVAAAQHPVLDAVANKVVQKYQTSSCEQLMQAESPAREYASVSGESRKPMETAAHRSGRCATNLSGIVADQVVDKLIQCGMIP